MITTYSSSLEKFPLSYLPLVTTPPIRYKMQIDRAARYITLLLIFNHVLKYFMIKKNKRKNLPCRLLFVFYYLTIFIYWIMSYKKSICQSHSSKKYLQNPYIRKIRKKKREFKVGLLKCKEFSSWLFFCSNFTNDM